MALATWQDVQDRLLDRTLTESQQLTIAVWIGDLESDIRLRIPAVDAMVELSPDFGNRVKRAIFRAVKRVLDNPKGLRSTSFSIDDYTQTDTVDRASSSGDLAISDADWAELLPAESGDAWTITPYGQP